MLLSRNPRSGPLSLGLLSVYSGAALQMVGLAYDVRSHAGDSHAASHEAVFTLSNPGHVLLGLGLAAVVVGTVVTFTAVSRGSQATGLARGIWRTLPAVAFTVLAFAAFAFVLRSGQVTLGSQEPAAVLAHAHTGTHPPWPAGREAALLNYQLTRARVATAKYVDINVAREDGFVPLTPDVPGLGMHMINPARVDNVFRPEEPEILLYTWVGHGWKYLGIMYVVGSATDLAPPEGFAGQADVWHFHSDTCELGGLKMPMDDRMTAGQCAALGGSFKPGRGPWGLHVWLGTPNPNGIFAHDHPAAAGLGGLFVRGDVADASR